MTTYIEESGLYFGDYEIADFFHAETAEIYRELGDNIKTVEFVLRKNEHEVLFVEAKSSSPQPGNNEDFDKFIEDIAEKFSHSNDVLFSVIMNRIIDLKSELPNNFRIIDYSKVKIINVLVINGHKTEWLPPIRDALVQQLKSHIKIWHLDVIVLNDGLAIDCKLARWNKHVNKSQIKII
ncbi:hypothetical protein SAMD00024442_4_58 [Candidatus Symbiothrix dinenymphae]|nr:hypothetical protein SAMD00024442_4_58 [Candidatus Symbiothrix dinenymphae]